MSTRQTGGQAEKIAMKALDPLNPRPTKGSGQVHGDGDLITDLFAVEVKSGRSVSLSNSRIEKLARQAARVGLPPLLVSVIGHNVWASLPVDILLSMLGYTKREPKTKPSDVAKRLCELIKNYCNEKYITESGYIAKEISSILMDTIATGTRMVADEIAANTWSIAFETLYDDDVYLKSVVIEDEPIEHVTPQKVQRALDKLILGLTV